MDLCISKAQGLQGEIAIPGDKSISHRAVMFGALAEGETVISNFLPGADCRSTIQCFRALGIDIAETPTEVRVVGGGVQGLQEPADVLDVGNSGTTLRLLSGILAGQKFYSTLTGDASIRTRPMGRVTDPLRMMGAKIWGRQRGKLAPLAIQGAPLAAIRYALPVASAQVKSAILLAGLYATGVTVVEEPKSSRDHTERMLQYFGVDLEKQGNIISMDGGQNLQGRQVAVPGDISSAAFFLVAASIVPNSRLLLKNVGVNPTRDGIIEVLLKMGAQIEQVNPREVCGEPVADLLVSSSSLRGTLVEGDVIPRLIDEIPVLAVAAACAQGETIIRDAAELKVKESNRIATVIKELSKFGVQIQELPDGMVITGAAGLCSANCESYHDHRIAMAMAVAGLVAEGTTQIQGAECVDVSFPGFEAVLKRIAQ